MSTPDSKVTSIASAPAPAKAAEAAAAITPAKKVVGKSAGHDAALSGDVVTILIFPAEGPGGADAVFASLNGVGYNIPRDVNVEIPVELEQVLANAIVEVTSPAANGGGVTTRNMPRYNYRRV